MIYDSQCCDCTHLVVENHEWFCPAFPDGIPDELAFNDFIHDKKHPDQVGDTIFESRKED